MSHNERHKTVVGKAGSLVRDALPLQLQTTHNLILAILPIHVHIRIPRLNKHQPCPLSSRLPYLYESMLAKPSTRP